ncbi:speckle-type poz protein [Anaeramoeba ignava]|uniref:Speckle-type poz protein n=1 Tax=Anaeramoeba ignava TaxID=1746090 RepID=A0A9Q0LTR1_ANAIG|nr:speckle-type poz protein [Anaeramoeba ignava]
MSKLLNLNDFSDLQIKSNDSTIFKVHRLIILTRFDNNNETIQKFINNCSRRSKEDVQIVLNFLYSGFPDFVQIQQILNEESNKNTQNPPKRLNIFFHISNPEEKLVFESFQEKNKTIEEFFKEIGFDLNWIQSKKGRKGILKDLSKLYQQESTKDFTIICEEEKEIKVHKLILILRSELFKGMFQLNVQDSSNRVHDYSGKSFETIQTINLFSLS